MWFAPLELLASEISKTPQTWQTSRAIVSALGYPPECAAYPPARGDKTVAEEATYLSRQTRKNWTSTHLETPSALANSYSAV